VSSRQKDVAKRIVVGKLLTGVDIAHQNQKENISK